MSNIDVPVPIDKLSMPQASSNNESGESHQPVVLLAPGSFNPPTFMHLQMFDIGKNFLLSNGYDVLGAYMSPVNDAYGKKDLARAEHRIKMCQLAARESKSIMVDPWEAIQKEYQRTLTVLERISCILNSFAFIGIGNIKVMLVCGADLLSSFATPGVWLPEQILGILKHHGVLCIARKGTNLEKLISECPILSKNKENIFILENNDSSDISSTKVRENLANGSSVQHLIPQCVENYILANELYGSKPKLLHNN